MTATGRLRVRRPTVDDLDDVFRIHSDPRTNLHNPDGPDADRAASTARLEQWLQHWALHGFGYWVVQTTSTPTRVVGFSGVRHETWLGRPVLNLYYRFDADWWGQGFASETARHAVAWAADAQPGVPVLAYTTADNVGSQRTAVAAGLTRRTDLDQVVNDIPAVVLATHW